MKKASISKFLNDEKEIVARIARIVTTIISSTKVNAFFFKFKY